MRIRSKGRLSYEKAAMKERRRKKCFCKDIIKFVVFPTMVVNFAAEAKRKLKEQITLFCGITV